MKVKVISEDAWKALSDRIFQLRQRYDHELERVRKDYLYSSEEVAGLLGVTTGTLAVYRSTGRIGFIKVGRRCLYRWKDIEPFIRRQRINVA